MPSELLSSGRVAILGAGREGQAAYSWLCQRRNLPISILAEHPCDPSFSNLLREVDKVLIEPFSEDLFKSFDLLIRSPGVSPYRQSILKAMDFGVQVTTPSNLWFDSHPDANTVCITGTKGKSTTSSLLAHLIKNDGIRVQLAGNIGEALLSCEDEPVDWWVIELSSYQIADLKASPTISMILNYSPEHLDWHGGEDNYKRDKLRLGILSEKGRLVLNHADHTLWQHFSGQDNTTWFNSPDGIHIKGNTLFQSKNPLPVKMPKEMPGHHNLCNVAAALTVSEMIGLDAQQSLRSVSSFKSLPHRLQNLGVRDGVRFINDSIASTPVATLAALEALQGKSVVLLLGGLDAKELKPRAWKRRALS